MSDQMPPPALSTGKDFVLSFFRRRNSSPADAAGHARRRSRLPSVLSALALVASATTGIVVIASPSALAATVTVTTTFVCDGQSKAVVVPPGVTSISVLAVAGISITGTMAVTPGETLTVDVGCRNGYGGFRGGAAGQTNYAYRSENGKPGQGATTIKRGSTVVLAAGGDGGSGGDFHDGSRISYKGGPGGNAEVAGSVNGRDGKGCDLILALFCAHFPTIPGGTAYASSTPAGGAGGNGSGSGGGGGGGGYPTGGLGGAAGPFNFGLEFGLLSTYGCCSGAGGGAGISYVDVAAMPDRVTGTTDGSPGEVVLTWDGAPNTGSTSYGCGYANQTYTVPNVPQATKIAVDAQGAQSGSSAWTSFGYPAGALSAEIAVTPGEQLTVAVGCVGGTSGGFGIVSGGDGGNGSASNTAGHGGGGATGIKRGSTMLVVAAGSGGRGGGSNTCPGGRGGYGNGPIFTLSDGSQAGDGATGSCAGAGFGAGYASAVGPGAAGGDAVNQGYGGGGGGAGYPNSGGGGTGGNNLVLLAGGGGGGGGQNYRNTAAGVTGSNNLPTDRVAAGFTGDGIITITPIFDFSVKSPQTITAAHFAFASIGESYEPSTSASSGLPVQYSLAPTSTGCVIDRGVVTFISAGTCLVNADQPGDAQYLAAPTVVISTRVKQDQIITFTPPASGIPGGSYTPSATSTSGLPVSFSLDPASTGCTLIAGVVTFTGVGSCKVRATQGGNSAISAAPPVLGTTAIGMQSQTISFTGPLTGSVGGSYTALATATSFLPVTFTIDPASIGCTLAAGVVTYAAPGNCIIDANQAGNAIYDPAPQVQVTTTIAAGQTITFPGPSSALVGTTFTARPTSTSGLFVTVALDASSSGCTLNPGTYVVTFTAAGTCVLNANQAGGVYYTRAAQVQLSIEVQARPDNAAPTVAITAPTPNQTFAVGPITISGTAADDVAVQSVGVAIYRNVAGGQFWNGVGWQSANVTVPAVLAGPGGTSTTWSYSFNAPVGGVFATAAVVTDTANKTGLAGYQLFSVRDLIPPITTVDVPTVGGQFTVRPIVLSGTASDNAAVADVWLGIYRPVQGGQFWNGTAWQVAYTTVHAVVVAPGTATTAWSYSFNPPQSGGLFYVSAIPIDTSNLYSYTEYRPFNLPDAVPPTAVITSPVSGGTVGRTFTVSGTAADDHAIGRMAVVVYQSGTGKFWNGAGFQDGYIYVIATLATPGELSSTWTIDVSVPASGTYLIGALPIDGSFNTKLTDFTAVQVT